MKSETSPCLDDDHALQGFNVAEALEARAIRMQARRKRVRTRAKLLAVAARELERVGYEALTVELITSRAGIVRATFYLYFNSKSDIASAVVRKYWALMYARRPRGRGRYSFFQSIHRSNVYMANLAAENANLFAAKHALLREDDGIARRAASINEKWANIILRIMIARGINFSAQHDTVFLRTKISALINLSDTLLIDVRRLHGWTPSADPVDIDMVIRLLDDLWLRAICIELRPDEATNH